MHEVVAAHAEASTQGQRRTMENASVIVPSFRGNPTEFPVAI
jgi:hypothetical protein